MIRRIVLAAAIVGGVYYCAAWCTDYFSDFRQKTTDSVEARPVNEDGKPDDPLTKSVRNRRAKERVVEQRKRAADESP